MTTAGTGEAREIENVHDLLKSFAATAVKEFIPERDEHGNPRLARFLIDNGRLPYITDEVKPWEYRGWLVAYIQLCEAHPLVTPRYDYVLRTIDAGQVLNEPIPEISFVGEFDPATKPGMAMLMKCIEYLENKSGTWNAVREFFEWLAFGLGVTHEPSKLGFDLQEFLYRNFSLEHLLLHPSDYLGQILCEQNHGKRSGFFPTPMNICEFMSMLNFVDAQREGRELKTAKVEDCCVGTGRMLLAASNYSLRLYGQDIDYLCCLVTKINLALYAPWHLIPEEIFDDCDAPDDADSIYDKDSAVKTCETTQIAQETALRVLANTPIEVSQYDRLWLEKQKRRSAGKPKFDTKIQPGLFDPVNDGENL